MSHYLDDDRMFYREAASLSRAYEVEVVGAGCSRTRIVDKGIRITSYGKMSRMRHPRSMLEVLLYLRSEKFDVLHCFDLESLAIAILASLPKRRILIYDAHEHFPSMMARYFNLPRILSHLLEFLLDVIERYLATFCDGFVVVNDALARRFEVFGKDVVTVRNVASLSWYDDAPVREVLNDVTDPIVTSGGTLGQDKGLEEVAEAKLILEKAGIKCCFVLTGRVKEAPSSLRGPGFRLTGWLDYQTVPSYLRRAKVGLALIRPVNANAMMAQPNKLFAYLVAGLPVVATNLPSIKAIIEKAECGMLANPGSARDIAMGIAKLLKNEKLRTSMARNARRAAESEFNWEKESETLLRLYERIQAKQEARPVPAS
jgi:glycosyltransferase involved in cell wall biosynthesis